MAIGYTLTDLNDKLEWMQKQFPDKTISWEIDCCGMLGRGSNYGHKYRISDKNPLAGIHFPLGIEPLSATQLYNLLCTIGTLFMSQEKPLSVETIKVKPSEIADLAQSIADFLEDCQPDDVVVKLANSAFEEKYVLVAE